MLAGEILIDIIPPLKNSDTVQKALDYMSEFKVQHLPVVEENLFKFLVSEDVLFELPAKQLIAESTLTNYPIAVNQHQHYYDIVKLMSENKLTLIPVVAENMTYLGAITLQTLATYQAKTRALAEPGGILVINCGLHDYSLSEIARIIESEDVIILSSYITSKAGARMLEITFKLNRTDLSSVISSLERFNYQIVASYHQPITNDNSMERYESFMNYLNLK